MLDELLEYEQYMPTDPVDPKKFRLTQRNLCNDLAGIGRPLEIIARKSLYSGPSESAPDIDAAKEAVTGWLNEIFTDEVLRGLILHKDPGGKKDSDEKKDPDEQKYDSCRDKLHGFRGRFQKSYIRANALKSSEKTIDLVLASALDKGPLKRYALAAEKGVWENVYVQKKDGITEPGKTQKDFLLKLTAAYLIAKERHKDQTRMFLTATDVYNWMKSRSCDGTKKETFCFGREVTDDSRIVRKDKVEKLNKFSFHNDWIRNFTLLDITENEKAIPGWLNSHKGATVYMDAGCGQYLKERKA